MASQESKVLFRIAHISDLHFAKPTWSLSQFFSKRWLGNLNVLLSRKHSFDPDALSTLIPLFQKKQVQVVAITGDLSSTSHPAEFTMAKEFIETLEQEKWQVFTLPGNHDHYTRSAYKNRLFYDFFKPCYDPNSSLSLKKDQVSCVYLGSKWWIMGIDNACATSLISSNGLFSEEAEKALDHTLQTIPHGHSILLMNHFPLFLNSGIRKSLWRRQALQNLLKKHPQVKLFLHGHTHRHCIADLRPDDLPIILDSGSTSLMQGGSWNLIEITEKGCTIESFKRSACSYDVIWEPFAVHHFQWSTHAALV